VSEGGWFRRLLHRSRPAALGLRRRILLTITLGAIALSLFLAVTTYGLTQNNLVRQAEDTAVTTSLRNAQGVFRDLRSKPSTAQPAVESLTNIGVTRYLIRYQEEWIGGVTPYVDANLPEQIVDRVVDRGIPSRQIVDINGELNVLVGWDIPGVGSYFQFSSLEEQESTLDSVRIALFFASLISTGLGVLLGVFSARRAVRPLSTAAQAASAIAGGRLDTRLESTQDPDLGVLTDSFNDMAEALQLRVERDARFASDVSHELRSPLMTLSASVEVMPNQRSTCCRATLFDFRVWSKTSSKSRDSTLVRSGSTWKSCSPQSLSARPSLSVPHRSSTSKCPSAQRWRLFAATSAVLPASWQTSLTTLLRTAVANRTSSSASSSPTTNQWPTSRLRSSTTVPACPSRSAT
jgi:signal transduction histidine kinase